MKTLPRFLCHSISMGYAVALFCLCSCQDSNLPDLPVQPPVEETEDLADAYHDKIRTQPYPKADNDIYLNPTPLIVPQAMKTGACVQFALSRSTDFNTPESLLSAPQKWCMFNPHHKLEAGIWYWRFRPTSADGSSQGEWSETYSFCVKDETPVFITPAFSDFYTNAPRRYPRLFCFLDPYLDEARRNITAHPEYRPLLSRAQAAMTADYSAINPNERAEELKTHLRSLYDAYHLTLKFDYQQRMLQLLKQLLASPVSDRLLFASNFGATDIALCYALLYDQLQKEMTPAERTSAEELMLRVLRYYYPQQIGAEENHIFNNHFWQQNLRVLFECAFLLYDNPTYAAEVTPMMEYYYELWTARAPASGFNRDGVWHNGSGYFSTNVKTLYYMPMLFSYVSRRDFLQHPWYQNAGQATSYTFPPQSKSSGFGDGSEKDNEPNRLRAAFADFLARELNDPYAGWYASSCRPAVESDLEMRLYRLCTPRSYDASLPADARKMVWYKDAGEVVMHSNLAQTTEDVNLSFRSSTFGSGSHTTSSQNAFNLLYKGKEVYRSSGYYLNFSDAHNLMSYRHTRAHNTILVNGIGQPYSTKGYGNVMRAFEGKHITYCLGDASKAYSGISDDPMWIDAFDKAGIKQTPEYGFGTTPLSKYRRHILMLHPEGIVLVYDELEASQPVSYDWLLHSPSQLFLNPELLMVSHANKEAGFTAVTQLFCNSPVKMSLTDRFVVPPTALPDPAYPNQWHMTARIEGQSKTRILAFIQMNAEGAPTHIIRRNGNRMTIGNWMIEAQLDAAQPSSLTVSHTTLPVVFSYGNSSPATNGKPIQRVQPGSSLLYDEINGEYSVLEQTDRLPASTRAGYSF